MRSTTATGRVLAVGLMVLFSLDLAGQSAWGAETSTKARPDTQAASSYKKNPGTMSIAKAEFEGAGGKKDNQSMKVHEKERIIAFQEFCDQQICKNSCTYTYRDCYDKCDGDEYCENDCQSKQQSCDEYCEEHDMTAAEKECLLQGLKWEDGKCK